MAPEGGPLREHPLAAVAFAELGQALAHGRRSRLGIGEQVVPDLPLLARPRAQPPAPRRIPLVPRVRHEPKPWLEQAGAGPARASRDSPVPQCELGEPGEIRVVGEHPVRDRGAGVIDAE